MQLNIPDTKSAEAIRIWAQQVVDKLAQLTEELENAKKHIEELESKISTK